MIIVTDIGYIVVCEQVFDNKQGGITINNPYAQITLTEIPGKFSFFVSISVYDIAPYKMNTLNAKMVSPSDEGVWDLEFEFEARPEESGLQHTMMNIPIMDFIFKEEGIYTFEVNINDNTKSNKLAIPVRINAGPSHEK